jgi:hypothetical protein
MDLGEELLEEAAGLSGAGGTAGDSSGEPIKRIRYSHEAIIDLIIQNPFCDGLWLSLKTGYTRSWLSTIMATDMFQAKLAERREKIVDPTLRVSLEEQAKGIFARSMEVLREKFNRPAENISDQLALQGFSATARALGYGARYEPPAPKDDTAAALVKHADNLVALLRREKTREQLRREVIEGEVYVSSEGFGQGVDQVSSSAHSGDTERSRSDAP